MRQKKVTRETLAFVIEGSSSTVRNMLAGQRVGFEYLYRTALFLGLPFEKIAPDVGISPAKLSMAKSA